MSKTVKVCEITHKERDQRCCDKISNKFDMRFKNMDNMRPLVSNIPSAWLANDEDSTWQYKDNWINEARFNEHMYLDTHARSFKSLFGDLGSNPDPWWIYQEHI